MVHNASVGRLNADQAGSVRVRADLPGHGIPGPVPRRGAAGVAYHLRGRRWPPAGRLHSGHVYYLRE